MNRYDIEEDKSVNLLEDDDFTGSRQVMERGSITNMSFGATSMMEAAQDQWFDVSSIRRKARETISHIYSHTLESINEDKQTFNRVMIDAKETIS